MLIITIYNNYNNNNIITAIVIKITIITHDNIHYTYLHYPLNADRSVCFGHHQRHILGPRLLQAVDGAGCKVTADSFSAPVDTDIRRRTGTSAQATGHLWYICRPRRFYRIHERVHDHWQSVLPIRRTFTQRHQEVCGVHVENWQVRNAINCN